MLALTYMPSSCAMDYITQTYPGAVINATTNSWYAMPLGIFTAHNNGLRDRVADLSGKYFTPIHVQNDLSHTRVTQWEGQSIIRNGPCTTYHHRRQRPRNRRRTFWSVAEIDWQCSRHACCEHWHQIFHEEDTVDVYSKGSKGEQE